MNAKIEQLSVLVHNQMRTMQYITRKSLGHSAAKGKRKHVENNISGGI